MAVHEIPVLTFVEVLAAVLIPFIYIFFNSFIKEPYRQQFNAIMVAGAGGAYLSGGLGAWDIVFTFSMAFIALGGLYRYAWIGVAWLLHTVWDVLHHLYAEPILSFVPTSSAGCAITDVILAIWFFYQAPPLFTWFRRKG